MKAGRFITFEGTEGAGKSTLIREVARLLSDREIPFILTREPGGSPLAEKIRTMILSESMGPWTEVFLYEAARADHMASTIAPALREGRWVLCDRFSDSTLAYQGQARGLPWKSLKQLNQLATGKRAPDLTVWLDLDPAVGLARASDRNRFEEEGLQFQKRVRSGFARAQRESRARWLKLAVKQATPTALAARVLAECERRKWLRGL